MDLTVPQTIHAYSLLDCSCRGQKELIRIHKEHMTETSLQKVELPNPLASKNCHSILYNYDDPVSVM